MPENAQMNNYITELRRGSLTMAVLGCLKTSHYGYALLQTLQDMNVNIEANTLYPLLRRLEGQGLLVSKWDTSESRPRKYYIISSKGQDVLAVLLLEWNKMQKSIDMICGGEE